MATATRERELARIAAHQLLCVGHHMPFPSVGYVVATDVSYRWVPLTDQLRVAAHLAKDKA